MFSAEYEALLRRQHAETKWGGDQKFRHMDELLPLLRSVDARTILDYGAGRESLANHVLRDELPYKVYSYDPGTGKLGTHVVDVVVCCDVLEHVEPHCLEGAIEELARLAHGAMYLVIALRQAKALMVDGSPQHLIVETSDFWLAQFRHCRRLKVLSLVEGKELRLWVTRENSLW